MVPDAPDDACRSKGKRLALPCSCTSPGGGRETTRFLATAATPPTPGKEEANSEQESLKAAVEPLRARLETQEEARKSLEKSNALKPTNCEELRKPTSNETVCQRTSSNRRLVANDDAGDGPTPPSQLSLPIGNLRTKSRRIRASERKQESLKVEAHGTLTKGRREDASSDDDGTSMESLSSSPSSSSDKSADPLGSPSPPSSPSSSDSSFPSSLGSSKARRRGLRHRSRQVGPLMGRLDVGTRKLFTRLGNCRFKSLMNYRTYFLLRRSSLYSPNIVQDTSKLTKRLDGAS